MCVLHGRVRLQDVAARSLGLEFDVRSAFGFFLLLQAIACLTERVLRLAALAACTFEFRLCLPQAAGLPARLRTGIGAVLPVEAIHCTQQRLELLQLVSVVLQLAKCVGYLCQQLVAGRIAAASALAYEP